MGLLPLRAEERTSGETTVDITKKICHYGMPKPSSDHLWSFKIPGHILQEYSCQPWKTLQIQSWLFIFSLPKYCLEFQLEKLILLFCLELCNAAGPAVACGMPVEWWLLCTGKIVSFIILHQHFNTHRLKKILKKKKKKVTDFHSRLFSESPNALTTLINHGPLTSVLFFSPAMLKFSVTRGDSGF